MIYFVFYKSEKYNQAFLKAGDDKIIIENVEEDFLRKLLVWYENIEKTGGGRIVERHYLSSKKMLLITYENKNVAERVIKFGEIEIGNRKYQARSFSRISVQSNLYNTNHFF